MKALTVMFLVPLFMAVSISASAQGIASFQVERLEASNERGIEATIAVDYTESEIRIGSDVLTFDSINRIVYERTAHRRYKSGLIIGVVVWPALLLLFSKGKKHWLTIEYDGGFAYMRMDKSIQQQTQAAISSAGFEIQTIIED